MILSKVRQSLLQVDDVAVIAQKYKKIRILNFGHLEFRVKQGV